jgi:elongation factor Tu
MTLPAVTVGVLGHVAHGKTTLTAAITSLLARQGKNPTKALSPEEITNKFIFRLPEKHNWAEPMHAGTFVGWKGRTSHATLLCYQTERSSVVHFDLPGHVSRLDKIATRAAFLDVAVLVVSAQDGIQPQTREHLLAAAALGVSRWIIFLNYCDEPTDPEMLDLIEIELRSLLASSNVQPDEVSIIRGSALRAYQGDPQWQRPVWTLIEEVDRLTESIVRDLAAPPIFLVERAYEITRRRYGTFVGKLLQGVLDLRVLGHNALDLYGFSSLRDSREFIYLQHLITPTEPKTHAASAGVFGLLVCMLSRDEIFGGQVIALAGSLKTSRKFICQVKLLSTKEGGRKSPLAISFLSGARMQFFLHGAAVEGAVGIEWINPNNNPNASYTQPGDETAWKVELRYDLYLAPGMPFVIADGSDGLQPDPSKPRLWGGLIGYGKILSVV